jgi:hypothetical protein
MHRYGNVVAEKNGHCVLAVYERAKDGNESVVGYAIQSPDGNEVGFFSDEVGFFSDLADAIEELGRITSRVNRFEPF